MDQPSSFSLFYYTGAPNSPDYSYTLTGTLAEDSVTVIYEETRKEEKTAWNATLQGPDYEECLRLLRETRLHPGVRAGSGYQVTLRAEDGASETGQPINEEQWVALARKVEQFGPAAKKRRKMLALSLLGALYVAFQILLIIIWLLLFIAGIGGALIHLLLVLALFLAIIGAIAGAVVWARSMKK